MPHGAGGHQQAPGPIPFHEQSRRQQQYHNQMYNPAPHSPIHANGYAYHHTPQPFYPQHQPSPQTYARWHQIYAPSSYGHMPQPQQVPHYPPRSPLVVSSHPYSPVANTHAGAGYPRPATMHAPLSQQNIPQAHKSPAPMPQTLQSSVHGQVGLPSPAPTPPAQEETPIGDMSIQEGRQDTMQAAQDIERIDTPSERAPVGPVNPLSLPPQTRTPYYPQVCIVTRGWREHGQSADLDSSLGTRRMQMCALSHHRQDVEDVSGKIWSSRATVLRFHNSRRLLHSSLSIRQNLRHNSRA